MLQGMPTLSVSTMQRMSPDANSSPSFFFHSTMFPYTARCGDDCAIDDMWLCRQIVKDDLVLL